MDALQQGLAGETQKLADCTEEIEQLTTETTELRQLLAQKDAHISEIEMAQDGLSRERDTLQKDVTDQTQKLAHCEQELQRLATETTEFKKSLSQKDADISEMALARDVFEQERASLQSELARQEHKLSECEVQLELLRKENEATTCTITELIARSLASDTRLQESMSAIARKDQQIDELTEGISDLRSQLKQCMQELDLRETQISEYRDQAALSQQKLENAQTAQSIAEGRIAELEVDLVCKQKEHQEGLSAGQSQIDELNRQLHDLTVTCEEHRARTTSWIEEFDAVLPLLEAELRERGELPIETRGQKEPQGPLESEEPPCETSPSLPPESPKEKVRHESHIRRNAP
jgi:chromosome segregation ATPase